MIGAPHFRDDVVCQQRKQLVRAGVQEHLAYGKFELEERRFSQLENLEAKKSNPGCSKHQGER
jgi:hypothetical protein